MGKFERDFLGIIWVVLCLAGVLVTIVNAQSPYVGGSLLCIELMSMTAGVMLIDHWYRSKLTPEQRLGAHRIQHFESLRAAVRDLGVDETKRLLENVIRVELMQGNGV